MRFGNPREVVTAEMRKSERWWLLSRALKLDLSAKGSALCSKPLTNGPPRTRGFLWFRPKEPKPRCPRVAWRGYAAPGARIGRRARGRAEAPSMAPQPLLDVLSRTPLRAPPVPATRQGHKYWLAAAQHRRDVAKRRAVWSPLHPRRSSACAQGVAGHGRPAKACHDRDVVSGRPRAQALRRGPARQGRRGCGVPSLWFLSLGKQRKEPAPGRVTNPEHRPSQVRNPERWWSLKHPKN